MDVRTLATMLAALFAPLTIAGCAGTAPADGHASDLPAAGYAVAMGNMAFTPATLTVPVGSEVTWTNKDSIDHTVTTEDAAQWGTAGSGDKVSDWMHKGETWSHTFTAPGTYHYYCKPHASMSGDGHARGMTGKIVVE